MALPGYLQQPSVGEPPSRGCLFGVIAALIAVIVAVVVGLVVGLNSSPKSKSGSLTASSDITISSCVVDKVGIPEAKGTILNHLSVTSDYTFTVSFLNPAKTVLAQGFGGQSNIGPHQSAPFSVTGGGSVSGAVTCRLVDVARFAPS